MLGKRSNKISPTLKDLRKLTLFDIIWNKFHNVSAKSRHQEVKLSNGKKLLPYFIPLSGSGFTFEECLGIDVDSWQFEQYTL